MAITTVCQNQRPIIQLLSSLFPNLPSPMVLQMNSCLAEVVVCHLQLCGSNCLFLHIVWAALAPPDSSRALSSQAGGTCCAWAQSCHSDVCVVLLHCAVPVGLQAARLSGGLPALLCPDFCSFHLQDIFGLLMIFDGFLRCSLYSKVLPLK